MKKVYTILAFLISSAMLSFTVYANRYPETNFDGTVACTYYVWEQVYNNQNIELVEGLGDAGDWFDNSLGIYARGQTPAVGAIACWDFERDENGNRIEDSYGHVAYVTEVDSDGSFSIIEGGNRMHGASGVGGRKIPDDGDWPSDGFIYPGGSLTTTAELRVERKFYNPGDTVRFYFGGQNTSGTYTLGIYKSFDRYKTVDVTGDSYSIQLNEVESYSAYMTAYSAYESGVLADSNWVDWQVLPLTAELSASAAKCNVNDTVVLTFGGNNNHTFAGEEITLGVWRNGTRIVHQNISDDTYTVNCTEPGDYSAYMTAYGGGTYKDSNWVYWTVYPLSAELSVSVTKGTVGDTITLTFDGDNNLAFSDGCVTMGIWRNGSRIVHKDVYESYYNIKCDEPGEYSAYMTAYGGGTYKDSNWVYWTIEEKPVQYSVSFSPGSGIGIMPDQTVDEGASFKLPVCTFTAPENKRFKSWSVNGKEYSPGAYYTVTGNTTVIAVWEDIPIATQIISVSPSSSGTCVVVYCSNANAHVICAAYDKLGKMADIEILPAVIGEHTYSFSVTSAYIMKVFVLDEYYRPLCESVEK